MPLLLRMLVFQRKRTSTGLIMYALYLYFLGLSFRSTAKALDPFIEKRSHVAVWNWVQLFNPNKFYLKRSRVTAFIIDETMLQVGSAYAWLWVAIEPIHRQVLGVYVFVISIEYDTVCQSHSRPQPYTNHKIA
jgi:transposase-like protein